MPSSLRIIVGVGIYGAGATLKVGYSNDSDDAVPPTTRVCFQARALAVTSLC